MTRWTTHVPQPEASRNVQKYSKDVYLRSAGAQQCNIHSTLLVPLFRDAECAKTIGVLEVVQNTEDMQFGGLITSLNRALSVRGGLLYRVASFRPLHRLQSHTITATRVLPAPPPPPPPATPTHDHAPITHSALASTPTTQAMPASPAPTASNQARPSRHRPSMPFATLARWCRRLTSPPW